MLVGYKVYGTVKVFWDKQYADLERIAQTYWEMLAEKKPGPLLISCTVL